MSHKTLRLRSTRGEQNPTRVDVVFNPVAAMHLPASVENLVIERAGAVPPEIAANLGRKDPAPHDTLYRVTGTRCDGWVVAGNLASHEDEGEYDEPSALNTFLDWP